MATPFSIQDILSLKKTSPAVARSCSPTPSPCSSPEPLTLAVPKQALPETVEVTVLESSVCPRLEEVERRGSRKRSRDCSSLGSSTEVSAGSEMSDPDSPTEYTPIIDRRMTNPKRPRTAFTTAQLRGLEHYFGLCPYPDSMGRDVISRVTGIDDTRIQVWFQNRRARFRKREQALSNKSSVSPSPSPTAPTTPVRIAPKPSQPHTSPAPTSAPQQLTLKPPAPCVTAEVLRSYHVTALAYTMQALNQKGHSPSLPTYLPVPSPRLIPSPNTQEKN